MNRLALALQSVGTTLVTIGLAAWSVPVGIIFAGVALIGFGLAAERGNDARKASQT
jgi:uncharacterized membrane protein